MEKNTDQLRKSKMSVIGITAIIFSFVAAGCFGIEEAISASGPGMTIIMLLVFPFIWAFPLSEMVGELGAIFPSEGGIYSWGRETFGEFWGWQLGLWGALTTWLCQAEYCAIVAGYAAEIVDLSDTGIFMVKIAVVIVFTVINIIGLDWLEKLETFFGVLVVVGFAAVAIVGFANWHFNPFDPIFNPEEGAFHSVGEGVGIIIWMFLGYECMGNLAEEVDDPQKIPKAMRLSQPIIALSYILPTLAALAAVGSWEYWNIDQGGDTVGYVDVLLTYVGSWAGIAFTIIAIISNCSIFCSYIAHGSRAFFVMADDHMFPKFMCKLDKRNIPTVSILLLAVVTVICCQYEFTTLVMITNSIQLFMYIALIAIVYKVRKIYPAEKRKERGLMVMPGGSLGFWVLSACVFIVSLFAIYVSGTEYFMLCYVTILGGLLCYIIFKWIYKGRVLDDPEAYPLNPKTKLGLGDLIDIGAYLLISGVMALVGFGFLNFYEAEYGEEYYLEEYEEGILANWSGMLHIVLIMGVALTVVGLIIYLIGKKTEGPQIAKLKEIREKQLDERIRGLIGFVPDKK